MSKAKHILFLAFLLPMLLKAQTNPELVNNYIEKIIEQTISSSEGQTNVETIISDLEFIFLNPINLNATNAQELDKLWILNDFQIKSLLDYRKKMGQIVSIYELNYIYGFNENTVDLITPFVYIGSRKGKEAVPIKEITNSLKHELLLRASQQSVSDDNYRGTDQKYYARYKAWYRNRLNIGFIAEKDAGEEFFTGSNSHGFDFYSGYIQYNGQKALKTIVVGDYRVRAGQGLLIWPGYSSGKSSQITSVQKRGQGITGNTSADEYGFYRGGAVSFGYKGISASFFGSYKQIDASYDSVLGGIETIRSSGLHRTNSENESEKNNTEQIFGAKINYTAEHFNWGLNWLNCKYSSPILPSEKVYQIYNFEGQEYNGISTDYKLLLQRIQFFGELAYSNTSFATINGVNLMPHPQFVTSLIYRNYQRNYFSPYSNALSENSTATNEEGLYAGIQWSTDWRVSLSAYADIFSFPWIKSGVDGPSNGKEYLLEAVYKPQAAFQFSLRYKCQEKIENYSEAEGAKMNNLEYFRQDNIRIHLWYLLSHKVSMSTRYELSKSGFSKRESNPGHMIYQDIVFKPISKMQLNFRYAWFDISDSDSRIYAYESNARYVYSMPAFYHKGTKTYLLCRYKFSNTISVWLRYSYTNYFDEEFEDKHEGLIQIMMSF